MVPSGPQAYSHTSARIFHGGYHVPNLAVVGRAQLLTLASWSHGGDMQERLLCH